VVADPSKQRVMVDEDFQLITFDFVTEPQQCRGIPGAHLQEVQVRQYTTTPRPGRSGCHTL